MSDIDENAIQWYLIYNCALHINNKPDMRTEIMYMKTKLIYVLKAIIHLMAYKYNCYFKVELLRAIPEHFQFYLFLKPNNCIICLN